MRQNDGRVGAKDKRPIDIVGGRGNAAVRKDGCSVMATLHSEPPPLNNMK